MSYGMSPEPENSKIAFVFPGIGVALSDHESLLYSEYPSVYAPFFEEGSALAGIDFTETLLSGTVTELGEREIQIFIYCFSAGTFHIYARHNVHPELVAGYSFGIYTALYAAKVFSFSDGLAILDKAYMLMAQIEQEKPAGISAVIGLALPDLSDIVEKEGLHSLCRINSNNEYCHIFCGIHDELDRLNMQALAADAVNAVTLDVSLPYHHPVMAKEVKEPFTDFLADCTWQSPGCPVVSTIDQRLLTTPDELLIFTAEHLHTPLTWYKTVERLYAEKCSRIVECGPGISLTQNARFISGKVEWINCKNCKTRLGI
jgi:[acyl-carrier-protein] S-malonyltransferase